MKPYHQKEIDLFSFNEKTLIATYYYPAESELRGVLLYFHGGGLIFGEREDLPLVYIKELTRAGYGLYAVDYPLAPEVRLGSILDAIKKVTNIFVDWILQQDVPYYIFGRSAGGYLTLQSAKYAQTLPSRPAGLILFYSYYNLADASFSVPNRYYLQYRTIAQPIIAGLLKRTQGIFNPGDVRFPIYLSARQKGNWMELITEDAADKKKYSLTLEDIKQLPPLFVATATQDPDVPTRQSRQLANSHADAKLHLVPEKAHDFDRTHIQKHGIPLFKELVNWLDRH